MFSGIGGLDLGLERAGLGELAWQCEANDYRRRVLELRRPGVPCFPDVVALAADPSVASPVDVLCGGFPCQDLSLAGAGAGLSGARSGLWFRYLELVRALKPRGVLIENVPGLLSRGIDVVVAGLTDAGYRVEATRLQAADLGAPHERERVFVVAVRADVAGELGGDDEYGGAWTPLPAAEVTRWTPNAGDPAARWPTPTGPGGSNANGGDRRPLLPGAVRAFWPTARASDGSSPGASSTAEGSPPLSHAVRQPWPTPCKRDGTGTQYPDGKRGISLSTRVREAWPTPTRTDATKNVGYPSGRPSLRTAVRDDTRTWPTPTVKGNDNHVGAGERSGDGLATVARRWATPMKRDWKSTSPAITAGNRRPLSEQVGEEARRGFALGRDVRIERDADGTPARLSFGPFVDPGPDPGPLSPLWTEALQGLPLGWTDLAVPNEALLEAPDWPRERGPEQHDWEPPRTVPARSVPERGERIEALGDAVVPACAEVAARRLLAHLEGRVAGAPQLALW